MRRVSAWLIAVSAVLTNLLGAAAVTFTYTPIDVPRAVATVTYGIMEADRSLPPSTHSSRRKAFYCPASAARSRRSINSPGSTTTEAFGINAGDQIVGDFGAN